MRFYKITFIGLILFLFILSGCQQEQSPVSVDSEPYIPAVNAITENGALCMDITIDKTMTVGSNSFRETGTKQVIMEDINSADMRVSATSSMQLGTFPIESAETYLSGKLFLTVNGSNFSGYVDTQTVINRFPPIQLITPALYNQVDVASGENEIILQYSQPSAPETWSVPEDSTTKAATGEVILNSDGSLKQAKYNIQYKSGVFDFDVSISVQYFKPEHQIAIPDENNYIPITDVFAPYYLEESYAYLEQVKYLQAQLAENIYSEVDPLYCDRTITIERSGNEATICSALELTDHSRGGQISNHTQTETFRDGSYSISTNDQAPVESSRIDSQDINLYCKTLLTSNILAPRFVTDATVFQQDTTITYVYSAGEELAETVCQQVCNTIYNNPSFLDNLAESYDDYKVEYVLTLDKISGIPLSSGLEFSGKHQISGIKYVLTAHYEQAYIFNAAQSEDN